MTTIIKRKINYTKVILVTLAIIGLITVIDNTFRLSMEIMRTLRSHTWNTHIIK
jgi:hypothetical protein